MTGLTPIDEIPRGVERLRRSFRSTPHSKIDYRLGQLKSLRNGLIANKQEIFDSLKKDFNRSELETAICDYGVALAEIDYMIANLKSFLGLEHPSWYPLTHVLSSIEIEKIPLGVILIISPFNYPLNLSFTPLVGVIAGGNHAVVKLPYDQVPNFCEVYKRLLEEYLDPRMVYVVNGGIPESETLLSLKYDKIVFTGSGKVGKIVARAAAEHLTPVILELGGKSPAIVTSNIDNLDISLNRILWGAFLNAGQTCVAVDYLAVEDKVYEKVISRLPYLAAKMFSNLDKDGDFTHIINKSGFERLSQLIDTSKGEIIYGGERDSEAKYIEPTIIKGINWSDSLMQDEIFGPILPIMKFSSLDTLIDEIKEYHDTPLAMYIFSDNSDEISYIRSRILSGSIAINETVMQIGSSILPFGGVGTSGSSSVYHGKYSIDEFTHHRSVLKEPFVIEPLLKDRYPPYTEAKQRSMMFFYEIPLIKGMYKPYAATRQLVAGVIIAAFGWLFYVFNRDK